MEYNHSKIVVALLLAFSFVLPNITFAVRGEGTATINGGANVNVVQASSNVFTIVLTVGASGISADAENPTFTIPTGFTAPDATYVANAGLVVDDGDWSVIGGGTCLVESPVVGLTAASGQVITVDVSTACTVGPGGNITLTYKGTSNTVGVVSVDVATNDVISALPVKSISEAPNNATLPTITVTADVAPTVAVTMDDDALNIGDTSLVTFTFSETPVGFTTADVTVANGAIGAIDASNPLVQTATYTPTDGIEEATNVITVGTDWTDAALNAGVGDDSPNYTIDTIAPTVAVTMSDAVLTSGETALVTFTFSETPVGFTTDDVTVANGAIGAIDASNPLVQTATYTPTNAITDATNVITAGADWTDAALNAGVGDDSPNYTIDTTAPTETITVIKLVVGGTKAVADFPLFVNGSPVTSGATNSFAAPATYTITETSNANYVASYSGFCPGGILSLTLGTPKICTVTNTYVTPSSGSRGGSNSSLAPIPPLIDLIKVPSPLSLPNGPGPVTYTYTLRNIGAVPVTGITMVGDTCSPITLISGDTNSDGELDLSETWIYRCATTLSKTHTNIVTATGYANDITAVDIASATVVVGAAVIPPLIHITKVPSAFLLSAPGGVTYTYAVTNPGTVPLSDVSVVDDKCTSLPGRVLGHPGDLNKNNLLDSNETWTFTCQTNLTATTTNTGIASGSGNGLTATDFALATVVVSAPVPKLPNTGFPPKENNTLMVLIGVLAISLIFYIYGQLSRKYY